MGRESRHYQMTPPQPLEHPGTVPEMVVVADGNRFKVKAQISGCRAKVLAQPLPARIGEQPEMVTGRAAEVIGQKPGAPEPPSYHSLSSLAIARSYNLP